MSSLDYAARVRIWFLAGRNLARRRRRSLLSGGALALGVASVLLLRAMTGGVQQLNTSMLVDGLHGAVQVHRAGYLAASEATPLKLDFEDSQAMRRRVLSVPGVRAVAPRILFGAALAPADDSEATNLMALAVEPDLEKQVTWRRMGWAKGWFDGPADPAVVLADELASGLGIAPQARTTPADQRPGLIANDRDDALNAEPVRIAGTIGSGLPGDQRYLLVPLQTAQRLLRMEGRVTEYAVAVHQLGETRDVKARLQAVLGPQFEVHTWDERAPFLQDIERGQDVFGSVLGLVVLLVVVLGIANALLMNVMERVSEVGTMLALGMRRSAIVRLFLAEGMLLALLGVAAGLGLGAGAIAFWEGHGLPIHTPGTELEQPLYPHLTTGWAVATAVAALVSAGLASLWAARRAARLSPVEALREP